MASTIRNNFTAGKLSPYLNYRSDLNQFRGGLSAVKNLNILPYGGLGKRGGLGYVADSNIANNSRLIPFEFSVTTTYLIEYGHQRIDIRDGATLKATIVTNFDAVNNNVFDIQYTQINDVMYIVHPNYPVHRLSRLSDTNWSYTEVKFDFPPIGDDNTSATTVFYNGTSLISSTNIFDANDVGTQFIITSTFPANNLDLSLSTNFTSTTMPVFRTFNIQTTGTWSGTIRIQKSLDNGSSWTDMLILSGREDRNIQTTGDVQVDATDTPNRTILIRVFYSYIAHTGNPRLYIWGDEYTDKCTFNITAYNSPTNVTATQFNGSHNGVDTRDWAFSAFNNIDGYPSAITLHDQRLVLAGSKSYPQTIWQSAIDDLQNFKLGSNDDDGIQITIAGQDKNVISYVQSAKVLMVGTLGGEYTVSGASLEEAITPNNVTVRKHSNFGSSNIRGLLYDDRVIFVQRQGNRLREVSYQFETDGFVSPDLSILAEDILLAGIRSITLSSNPFNILYIVMKNNTVVTMTYEKDQGARGFSKIDVDAIIHDVAVLRGTGFDRVYFLLSRNGVKYIEQISENRLPAFNNNYFLDAYRVYSGSATNTINGLTNLADSNITIYNNANGTFYTGSVSAGGELILPQDETFITMGYNYTASLSTMPIDVVAGGDTRRDKYDRITKCNLNFMNTTEAKIRQAGSTGDTIEFVDMEFPSTFYNGNIEVYINNNHKKDVIIDIEDTSCYDFNMLGFTAEYKSIED